MAEVDFDNMSEDELEAYVLAERKAAADIKVETAIMLENGNILFGTQGHLPDGQPTSSNRDIRPQDPDYETICKSFKLSKRGDSYLKQYKWVNERWELESEREYQ